MKTLQNLIELDSNVKIFVPSTIDVNKSFDNTTKVNETLSFLSAIFGGATSYDALGCWVSQTNGLIKERVIICESFGSESTLKANIENIINYCETLKTDMKQEAISLQVNNKLYFI